MPEVVANVKLTDNSKKVQQEMNRKIPIALAAIGAKAATHAMENAPVDTGRLKNSIAWAVTDKNSGTPAEPAKPEDSRPKDKPEDTKVYIGTNVEYAAAQEYGDFKHRVGKKHFLKDAATNYSDEYKSIMEAAMKS